MKKIKQLRKRLRELEKQRDFLLWHAKDNDTKKSLESYKGFVSFTIQLIDNGLTIKEITEKLKYIKEEEEALLKYNRADKIMAKAYIFCISFIFRIIEEIDEKQKRK